MNPGSRIRRITQLEKHCSIVTRNQFCYSRHCNSNTPFRVTKIMFLQIFPFRFITQIVSFFFFQKCYRYVDELLYWSGRRMLLDEYLQGDLTPNRLPPTWVSRTKFVFQSDDGGLAVLDTANDSVNILVTNHTLVMFKNWTLHKRKTSFSMN